MTETLALMESMPVAYTPAYGWELHDMTTGEILPVSSREAGVALRAASIRSGIPAGDLATVRVWGL